MLIKFEELTYQPDIYIKILIEENMTRRILQYCQRNPERVTQLYKYLVKDYLNELNDIFVSFIKQSAYEATNRSRYKRVCWIIKQYQKICGDTNAHKIINEMKQTYLRRPAFLDELEKIK